MRAGIIAAGEGARFRDAGIAVPKPLVRVGGQTLLERTMRGLAAAGVTDIALIVNDAMAAVVEYACSIDVPARLHPVVQTTASSMHSLLALAPYLGGERFVLATVDSILRPHELAGFVRAFAAAPDVDVLLSLTDFIDDEKPLYIRTDAVGRVLALGAAAEASGATDVTVGLYGMHPQVFEFGERAIADGMSRLRNFLDLLLRAGLTVRGHRLTKAIDVDRPADVEVAERFLAEAS